MVTRYERYWARTNDPQLVDTGQRLCPFGSVRSDAWLCGINRLTERLSERERTRFLAILATPPSRLVLIAADLPPSPAHWPSNTAAARAAYAPAAVN